MSRLCPSAIASETTILSRNYLLPFNIDRSPLYIFMRAIKVLGEIFVPIIPAIVASGLLLGIMSALNFMASNALSRSTPIT